MSVSCNLVLVPACRQRQLGNARRAVSCGRVFATAVCVLAVSHNSTHSAVSLVLLLCSHVAHDSGCQYRVENGAESSVCVRVVGSCRLGRAWLSAGRGSLVAFSCSIDCGELTASVCCDRCSRHCLGAISGECVVCVEGGGSEDRAVCASTVCAVCVCLLHVIHDDFHVSAHASMVL